MTGLVVVLFVIFGLWLAAVTVFLVALARYVGAVRAAGGGEIVSTEPPFRVDDDGPVVPSTATATTLDLLDQAGIQHDSPTILILFSIGCAPCEERIREISELTDRPPVPIVALLAGSRGAEALATISGLLLDANVAAVRDPVAHSLAEAIGIQSVPFAVLIQGDRFLAKTYVRQAADLTSLWRNAAVDFTRGVQL